MNQPQVSIFPAEMTTALYRRAIASAWRQKMLNETGNDQYGPHSLTVERIEMAIALHIECALINEYGEAQGAAAALALLTDMLEPSLLTAPPVTMRCLNRTRCLNWRELPRIMRRVWISVINSLRQLCIKLRFVRNLLRRRKQYDGPRHA